MHVQASCGGRPLTHLRATQNVLDAIRYGFHPSTEQEWFDRLFGHRGTYVRGELTTAVREGVLPFPTAEAIYLRLWEATGRRWYCRSLRDGRDGHLLGARTAGPGRDDPTIPRWWWDR